MKTLLSVLIVLAMATPLCADILFQEDFNGTAGNMIQGWNGWTGNSDFVISDTVIDQGNSAAVVVSIYDVADVYQGFSHPSVADEVLTFTATLTAPASGAGMADLRLRDASDTTKYIRMDLQGGEPEVQIPGYGWYAASAGLAVVDFKVVATDTRTNAYYREHGTETWNLLGGADYAFDVTNYDEVQMHCYTDRPGGLDSIQVTSDIPEPSMIALLATGLIGLLAYAWRKRK